MKKKFKKAIKNLIATQEPVTNSAKIDGANWFTVRNEDGMDRAEMLIYSQIGKDWWSDDGVGAKQFMDAMKLIPRSKGIDVGINCLGGNVWDGLAIYNGLKARGNVNTRVDGVAASMGSVIAMAGDKCEMPKGSLMMIHKPSTMASGNSDDMRKIADMLDKHEDVLSGIYQQKTGKSAKEIADAMAETTWFTAEEAHAYGLCDMLTEREPVQNNFDLSCFRNAPKAFGNKQKTNAATSGDKSEIMNRAQIIAMLLERGIKVEDSITDADLHKRLSDALKAAAAPPATPPQNQAPVIPPTNADAASIAVLTASLSALTKANEAEKKLRISAEVKTLCEERGIVARSESWTARAMADETVLDDLRAMPIYRVGAEPVTASAVIVGESPRDIEAGIMKVWGGNRILTPEEATHRGAIRAEIINRELPRLMPVLNTNTVSTDLKRTVILQRIIRAFATRILMLEAFSTALGAIKLEGLDTVTVPYFALDTTASTDFVDGTGYTTFGNTNSDSKQVTINKRKYQGLSWTSKEFARQPFMNMMMGASLKAEQLAKDIVNDVFSIIMTANFGASVKAEPAAAFDASDVADLKLTADQADWPDQGRSLILDSTYDNNLLKNSAVSSALNWGDNSPIREGLIKRILGFDYYPNAHIPSNSQNLVGIIVYKSAILFAQSPIAPTPEVRNLLTSYEVVVEPSSGATLEYRRFGDAVIDKTNETLECNYGYALGEAAALKRITSAPSP